MARETAAAKRARLEAERMCEQEKMKMTFPSILQDALQGAAKFGFDTKFYDCKLSVMNRSTPADFYEFELTATSSALQVNWSEDNQQQLNRLEVEVEFLAEELREREHEQALRDGALAKLTDAERAVLGL